MITTSIIILSYNTASLLESCLISLFKHITTSDCEVIVVDNDSTDDSVRMVKKAFPQVRLIENKDNVGFAAGCNIGAKKAKGEFLLFLNSDTELFENTPEKMMRVFRSYENAAVVGGMLENKDGTLQRSHGSFYDLGNVVNMLFGGDKAEMKRFTNNAVQSVDWVNGGLMMVKKDIFEKLGGFDTDYFMYVEDMEFCYRMYLHGYGVYIDPSSSVTHIGQGSSDRTFAITQIYKGLLLFYKKHKNKLQYIVLLFLLRVKAYGCILIGIITGRRQLVKTYKTAIKSL